MQSWLVHERVSFEDVVDRVPCHERQRLIGENIPDGTEIRTDAAPRSPMDTQVQKLFGESMPVAGLLLARKVERASDAHFAVGRTVRASVAARPCQTMNPLHQVLGLSGARGTSRHRVDELARNRERDGGRRELNPTRSAFNLKLGIR